MQLARSAVLALLVLTGACASSPRTRGARDAAKPLRGVVAEFQVISYDGETLRGRVLIGATIDPVAIDGRLYDWVSVELHKMRECGKEEPVRFWSIEPSPRPPRADEIITLRPGYWYGGKVSFLLVTDDEQATGIGLNCFEAELSVLDKDARVVATLPIHVVRTDKPPAPADRSAEPPKAPASDAGAP